MSVICGKCGKEIDKIVTNVFDHDGSDSDYDHEIFEIEEQAVYFETTPNWSGNDLTLEEQIECIKCPHCGEFPFKSEDVQVYDVVRVVMFKESE